MKGNPDLPSDPQVPRTCAQNGSVPRPVVHIHTTLCDPKFPLAVRLYIFERLDNHVDRGILVNVVHGGGRRETSENDSEEIATCQFWAEGFDFKHTPTHPNFAEPSTRTTREHSARPLDRRFTSLSLQLPPCLRTERVSNDPLFSRYIYRPGLRAN